MALTERFENDKIEIVTPFKHVQVRRATVIERDGVEISRTFERHSLTCGDVVEVEGNDTFIDRDISTEDADVQSICNAVWTQEIKDAYKAHLISIQSADPNGL